MTRDKKSKVDEKADRLAGALRDNLRRRKKVEAKNPPKTKVADNSAENPAE